MTAVNKALGTVWAAWCTLVFVHSLIIITPIYAVLYAVRPSNVHALGHKISRIWGRYIFFLMGISVKTIRRQPLGAGPYVFISNHSSYLDIPAAARAVSLTFQFLAKAELARVPFFGYNIRNIYIMVNRDSPRSRAESFARMKAALKEGRSIWLFPEGTRNQTSSPLGTFEPGAFQLAAKTGYPLGIWVFHGAKKLMPPQAGFWMMPGTIKAIYLGEISGNDPAELQNRARDIMANQFEMAHSGSAQ